MIASRLTRFHRNMVANRISARWSFIVLLCALALPACAQIVLSGDGTTPAAPATLKVGDTFMVGSTGNGLITYADGATIKLASNAQGKINPDGLSLQIGRSWMAFRKRGKEFVVITPSATLAVRGTAFGTDVTPDRTSVTLVEGALDITALPDGAKKALKAGETLECQRGKPDVRPSTPADVAAWAPLRGAPVPSSSGATPAGTSRMPMFHEQFLYGATRVESGQATVQPPPGAATGKELIPVGSEIVTPANSGAQIRLGCGSLVRLAPDSRLKVESFGLTLISGACLARHVGNVYPLKIMGAATLLISKDSVVEAVREGDSVTARVHVGTLQTPGLTGKATAGQSIEASGRTAKTLDVGPEPRTWQDPALGSEAPPAATADADIFGPENRAASGQKTGDTAAPPTSEPVATPNTAIDNPSQSSGSNPGKPADMRGTLGF